MNTWQQRRDRLENLLDLREEDLDRQFDDKQTGEVAQLCLHPKKDFRALETLVQTPQSSVCFVSTPLARNGSVFVRKSVTKQWADRMKGVGSQQTGVSEELKLRVQQTSPLLERKILLEASKASRHDIPKLLCALADAESLYIFLEYAARGSLWDLMESSPNGVLDEDVLRPWISQSVLALAWLHSAGWVHRDIKPHNMLITLANSIQITDFGSAAPLQGSSRKVPQTYCTCVVGTIDYIPPEVLLAHQDALALMDLSSAVSPEPLHIEEDDMSNLDSRIDSWSLGVVLYEALYGEAPFFHEAVAATYQNILDHTETLEYPDRPDLDISPECLDFMQCCLVDQEKRSTMLTLECHPFLASSQGIPINPLPPIRYPKNPLSASKTFSSTQSRPFDFSMFFSSPGLNALRQSRASRSPSVPKDQPTSWAGFTYLPPGNIFSLPEFAPLPPPPILKKSPSPMSFVTPARPGRPAIGTTTTARKKRPVTDLQAFAQTLEYGVLSVKKRMSASRSRSPRPISPAYVYVEEKPEDKWDVLDHRQKKLLDELDGLELRYRGLLARR